MILYNHMHTLGVSHAHLDLVELVGEVVPWYRSRLRHRWRHHHRSPQPLPQRRRHVGAARQRADGPIQRRLKLLRYRAAHGLEEDLPHGCHACREDRQPPGTCHSAPGARNRLPNFHAMPPPLAACRGRAGARSGHGEAPPPVQRRKRQEAAPPHTSAAGPPSRHPGQAGRHPPASSSSWRSQLSASSARPSLITRLRKKTKKRSRVFATAAGSCRARHEQQTQKSIRFGSSRQGRVRSHRAGCRSPQAATRPQPSSAPPHTHPHAYTAGAHVKRAR